MKKKSMIISFLLFFTFVPSLIHAQSDVKCPDVKQLEKTSMKDKEELLKALKEIVPATYQKGEHGEMISEWEVINALPFPKIAEKKDAVNYENEKNYE